MLTHLQMLRPEPMLADVSIGGIVYMLAIVMWVISKLFKKKLDAAPGGPATPSAPRPVDAELKELFETITGQKLEPIRAPPPPPPVAAPAPTPVRRAPAAPRRAMASPRAATPPARTSAPARAAYVAPPPPPAPARPDEYTNRKLETSRPALVVLSAPTLSYSMRSNSGRMAAMKLPVMRLGLGSASASGAASHMLDALRNPDGIRAAMVQRTVLGPPRAFDPA